MKFWGITGTNGKTTTTWIFAEFLNAAGRKCGYITTVEVFDGKDRYYTGYTTPPLAQLSEDHLPCGLQFDSALMDLVKCCENKG